MAEQRDFIGIDWVKGEVKAILAETRRDLEQFTESAGDETYLINCRKQLQQIHSTMKMLEQHGARLLTNEMLALLVSMERIPFNQLSDHLMALMQGMLLLPNYLEQVSRSGNDRPEQFKPLLKHMRELRNQPPLSEIDFFVPDITNPEDPLLPDQLETLRQKKFVQLVKRIRHKYQAALAGVLRNQHQDKQLIVISKVFGRLQNLCWGAPATLLWDAALALGAGLKDGDIPLNSDTIFLLREMDLQMKLLCISDVEGINDTPDETLLRNLFYQIAMAKTGNPLITSLRFRYQLDEALAAAQEEASENIISVETAEATAGALYQELSQIKKMIQVLMARIHISPPQLQELHTAISQLSGTMTMLGFAPQDQNLHTVNEQVMGIIKGTSPATETLQSVSRQLLLTEKIIRDFAENGQVLTGGQTLSTAPPYLGSVESARQKLGQVKQVIIEYLAKPGSAGALNLLPELMGAIHKDIESIPFKRAAQLVNDCGCHIQQFWFDQQQLPSLEELDAITDLIASLDYSLEQYVQGPVGHRASPEAEGILDVADTSLITLGKLASNPDSKKVLPKPEPVITPEHAPAPPEAVRLTSEPAANEPDDEIIQCFIEEATGAQHTLSTSFQQWKSLSDDLSALITIRRGFHTLKGSGRMVEANVIGELAWSVENMLNRLLDGNIKISEQMIELLDEVIQTLPELIADFAQNNQQLTPEVLVCMEKADALFQGSLFVTDEEDDPESDIPADVHPESTVSAPATKSITAPINEETFEPEDIIEPDSDTSILQLFLEEGFELIESSAKALERWLKETSNLQPVNELQRFLHTLKGGARMAQLPELDELCHNLEDVYGSITTRQCKPKEAPLALIQHAHDTIEAMLRMLASGKPLRPATALIERLHQWQPPQNDMAPAISESAAIETLPDYLGQKPASASFTPEDSVEAAETAIASHSNTQSGEMIRIPLDLLESLINLSGESSISRSRVEQQIAESGRLLDEVSTTVTRIREQVRRLDEENQRQMQAFHRGEFNDRVDFDLRDVDQPSEASQLSGALLESASDLLDLRDVLQENNLETEKILRQQSRTQIELQEQLTQSRMVSFGRLVPRLRQIVRLVSSELDKSVELIVTNAEGEMDRTMFEHILAPLEHMLRNAISHGIEDDINQRLDLGKPAQGQIEITIDRDGSDIVIDLLDDGRGIDTQLIKARAIEQGFISEDTRLSKQEMMHLILESGFSTAGKVTHISGRGVGLDVVNSEVRQLGGSITVDSELNKGTRFSLRLPFTQSVNRALMVEVGTSLYALPMPAIDGIAMISPEVMRDCYDNNTPLKYDGVDYKVMFLGQLLDNGKPKRLGKQCPVVLVQRGQDCLALHVDTIIGSREMITKSLGVQFAGLTGVNGATILGDGRVVVIIDPMALYRRQQNQIAQAVPKPVEPVNPNRAIKVLVIDDSVTVRKVASRLLNREGYEVDSAKDGVEAMVKLTEEKPDIVLLDIEMPNVDGFEVASSIRNNSLLQDLPIIMITSRTGEKHRNRALSLGVNEYIGKPFQEGPLLEAIQKLTIAV